jgi:hypothetical protein
MDNERTSEQTVGGDEERRGENASQRRVDPDLHEKGAA